MFLKNELIKKSNPCFTIDSSFALPADPDKSTWRHNGMMKTRKKER